MKLRTATLLVVALAAVSAIAQKHTNTAELTKIANQSRVEAQARKHEAKLLATLFGIPEKQLLPNGKFVELLAFERGRPVYVQTDNVNAALTTRANRVHPGGAAGLSLTGSGVTLGIWDGGTSRLTHQEYNGRVFNMDGEPRSGDHASHVTGTMIATGVSPNAKGMSYQGSVNSYGWNSDVSEMATAAAGGLRLSNHSYGYITGWYNNGITWYWYGDTTLSTTEDNAFGLYDATAASWDTVAYNAPYYLICKSAGNDKGEGPSSQPVSHQVWDPGLNMWVTSTAVRNQDNYWDGISYNGNAKNILTVGATQDVLNYTGPASVVQAYFSGQGPTDDGRIKPDICGNGWGLFSSFGGTDTAYGTYSGTSMSTPNVTGSLGLLVQHHRNLNGGTDMLASTLKGLAIHTADECGNWPGPDYEFGWGLLNTERAAQVLSQDTLYPTTVTENVLNNGGTTTMNVFSDGTTPLRVTICWTDIPGTGTWSLNDPTPKLVNDLDLRINDGSNTYQPWTLNPAVPLAGSVPGDNFRDNVEQILIDAPALGNYTITVNHKGVLGGAGSQAFSMIVTGGTSAPVPAELSTLNLAVSTIGGGNSTTGNVTLTNSGGGTVSLSSNTPNITVPASVTVSSGSSSAGFAVGTLAVASTATGTVTATMNAVTRTVNLQVRAASLTSVSVSPSSVVGGNGATGTVNVSGNVPVSGISVGLSDNSASVGTPASVTVAGGASSATFAVTTSVVASTTTAVISATFETTTQTANLTVTPAGPALSNLTVSPASVFEGTNTTGTVTLTANAPSNIVVVISQIGTSLTVPSSVTVTTGTSSRTFTIGTGASGTTSIVRTVQATYNGVTKQANITINPLAPTSVTVTPTSVKGGKSSTGRVNLNGPAGVGGAVVTVSDNSANATTPATVTVPAGATFVTFTITTTRPPATTNATISATRNGVTSTATLEIKR